MNNDMRSTIGRYLRGNNVYGKGSGKSPNPSGNNQYLSKLAKKRRMMMKKQGMR